MPSLLVRTPVLKSNPVLEFNVSLIYIARFSPAWNKGDPVEEKQKKKLMDERDSCMRLGAPYNLSIKVQSKPPKPRPTSGVGPRLWPRYLVGRSRINPAEGIW